MKINNKNWRTSAIGYLMLLFIVATLIMLLMGKVTIEQAGAFLLIIVGVLSSIGFIKTADSKNVNDIDNNQYGIK
jgi:uncharacterized membrane protein YcaP (DUF421 family)